MSTAALPKQVQAQLEEADRVMQGLTPGEPANTDTPPPDLTQTSPPEPQQAANQSTPPAPSSEEVWRNRYETLQGKFNSEIPALHQQIRELSGKYTQTLQELDRVKNTKPPEQPAERKPLVTTKDEETFGSDLIDAMRRVARDESSQVMQRLEALDTFIRNLAPQLKKVEQVEQTVAQTKSDQFWSKVNSQLPDWQQINADQKFLDWLKDYDPVAGMTRQDALTAAANALDADRVIAVFNLFKAYVAALPPAQPNQAQAELNRQVAPAKSSKATVPPQGPKTFTAQQYAYWTDHRRVHDTDNATLQRMLAEIEAAYAEGRIKW